MSAERPLRIVAAMSGGVDSSVTAAHLKRLGHEVIGVTMQLYDAVDTGAAKSCCAGRDIQDARAVAEKIGIPHYVFDYRESFARAVIEDFAATYAVGRTPVPCIRCNERVKFGDLMQAARDLGADALATGHYVRRVSGAGGVEMHRGRDDARDQSYFLFATTREQLDFLRFPLGDLTKPEVRAMAESWGLKNAEKPDSQDICFVTEGRYSALVRRLHPEAMRPGEIVDEGGRVLGRHDGIANFTVGQRKRLNIHSGDGQWFVLRLDAAHNRVVVGSRQSLMGREIRLEGVNWLADPAEGAACTVKVRSMRPAVPARVIAGENATAFVVLSDPEEAIAPGQACVFYRGTKVLGGGWIVA